MGRRRLTATLVGVAALAALLTGCGGDDAGGESTTTDALTKAQYVERATALCARHRDRIAGELRAVSEKLGQDGSLGRAEVEKAMEDVILPGIRSEYEELRKLQPPRGDEDFLDLMLSKFSRSLENGEEDLARLFRIKLSAYSEFAEGTLMTNEYGIKGCGSLRRSPQAVVRAYALS
ncbi:MAG TPA: hypothetical protein VNP96_00210 [Solirubrobacterales bacterium]|nr:hypothetical protein [Solirubrobacterales bacterium]